MMKYRRMNFGKNKQKNLISPWMVLFLMLAGVCVLWVTR